MGFFKCCNGGRAAFCKARRLLLYFTACERGAILVEAAIVLPVLIALFLGMVEFSTAFTAQRKVSNTASTLADLIAQTPTTTDADLADVVSVAVNLMAPYSTSGLNIAISSVGTNDNGDIVTLWSYNSPVSATGPEVGAPYTLPAGLISGPSSVIMVHVSYLFKPAIGSLLINGITLSSTSYYRPRVGTFVTKS